MRCRCAKLSVCLLAWAVLGCGQQEGNAAPLTSAVITDPALAKLLRAVEAKYNHQKSARLRFRQIYRQDAKRVREETGTLYLEKPGRMRWEYENPEPKLFLTDGRRLTLYIPAENRATEMAVKESDDLRTPLRFLLGRLRFEREFQQVEISRDVPPLEEENVVVKAIPKQMADHLEWVVLEITPRSQIRRLILNEPGGLQTEFRFADEVSNIPLSPQLFRFRPPAGTEIVRQ